MSDVEKVLEATVGTEPVKKTRKPRTKKTDTEAAPKAAEAKKTEAAPKKTAAKKPAVKKEAAPKTEKAPTKRTAAKKADAKQANVYIQFAGQEVAAKDILEAAKKAFAEANEGVAIETIELYVKPEEGAAYYVVNGVGGDDMKIEL